MCSMKNKQINGYDVGIIFSIIGIVASVLLIILKVLDNESFGVGLGLLLFCTLSLITNVRGKRKDR